MLAGLDWTMLSVVITDCFGEQTAQMIQDEWISAEWQSHERYTEVR